MQYIYDSADFRRYIFQNCHCVNAGQSAEERRLKYAIARSLGKSHLWSAVLRDWRYTSFAKFFGYSSWANLIKSMEELVK